MNQIVNQKNLAIFDTHCHLSDPVLFADLSQNIYLAKENGVRYFLSVATSQADWQQTIASQISENIYIALGIHPFFVNQAGDEQLKCLTELLIDYPRALVGEIGLDFFDCNQADVDFQYFIFENQLDMAERFNRPIVLHHRKSFNQCLQSFRRCQFTQGGFAHGFSGSLDLAKKLLDEGFVIGLGSVLLRENARKIRELIPYLPHDGFVLESDAPFMLPEKSNHPKNTATIAQIVADLRKVSLFEVVEQSTNNAFRLLIK